MNVGQWFAFLFVYCRRRRGKSSSFHLGSYWIRKMNRPQYRREWKKEVKKQFKVSGDKDVTIWKQWNFIGWTARGRGSILWPQPAVRIPWAVLTWHPINHTLPPPPSTSTPLQSPPSLSSILLCQPRSCTTIRLRSRRYWGWCRYLWAEQLVKSATHTHTHARARTYTLFNLISHFVRFSLFPSLEFIFSSLRHCPVPQLAALNAL